MTELSKPPMRGLARVAFRALQTTIDTELKEGWTAKSIYDRHANKLTAISYPQFVRYCRLLKQPAPSAPADAPEPEGPAPHVRKTFADHKGIADPALIRKLTSG